MLQYITLFFCVLLLLFHLAFFLCPVCDLSPFLDLSAELLCFAGKLFQCQGHMKIVCTSILDTWTEIKGKSPTKAADPSLVGHEIHLLRTGVVRTEVFTLLPFIPI